MKETAGDGELTSESTKLQESFEKAKSTKRKGANKINKHVKLIFSNQFKIEN